MSRSDADKGENLGAAASVMQLTDVIRPSCWRVKEPISTSFALPASSLNVSEAAADYSSVNLSAVSALFCPSDTRQQRLASA